ncbi:hypothetical protein EMIT0111MI5_110190 [Burkholderia sp. IT-111MI5]
MTRSVRTFKRPLSFFKDRATFDRYDRCARERRHWTVQAGACRPARNRHHEHDNTGRPRRRTARRRGRTGRDSTTEY